MILIHCPILPMLSNPVIFEVVCQFHYFVTIFLHDLYHEWYIYTFCWSIRFRFRQQGVYMECRYWWGVDRDRLFPGYCAVCRMELGRKSHCYVMQGQKDPRNWPKNWRCPQGSENNYICHKVWNLSLKGEDTLWSGDVFSGVYMSGWGGGGVHNSWFFHGLFC